MIKTNIGHLDTAAGVASLIKAVSAVENAELPPSLHFEQPNPTIDFASTPFYVNARLTPWRTDGPRRAGVTSLGVGGTNAHVVLEQAPARHPRPATSGHRLLLLSARSAEALGRARLRLSAHLRRHPDVRLDDVAFTLHAGRRPFGHRLALVVDSVDAAIEGLESSTAIVTPAEPARPAQPAVTFMFPGGGAQRAGMATVLYETSPTFRDDVDRVLASAARFVSGDLRALLLAADDRSEQAEAAAAAALERPTLALPALFAIEFALARLLRAWGVEPDSFVGHSLGEYVAACQSGVMTLDDAVEVVAARARLFESLPAGSMISVPMAADRVGPTLPGDLSIAAINGPELCVVSGPTPSVSAFAERLAAAGTESQRLRIGVAAHSQMLDPILDEFRTVVQRIRLAPPAIPYVSNVTGTWITSEEATDPDYWVRHLRQTVQFAAGIATLATTPGRVFVEVGPGTALSTLARLQASAESVVSTLGRLADVSQGRAAVLDAAGRLWAAGVPLDSTTVHDGTNRRRVPLPTYPFEHERYWIDPAIAPGPATQTESSASVVTAPGGGRDVSRWLSLPVWIRAESLPFVSARNVRWLLCTEHPNDLDGLASTIEAQGGTVCLASRGESFRQDGHHFSADPTSPDQLESLLSAAAGDPGDEPMAVIIAWARGEHDDPDVPCLAMLAMGQALSQAALTCPVRLVVLTRCLQPVGDAATDDPEQALAAGTLRVIATELVQVTAAAIDVDGNGWSALRDPAAADEELRRAVTAEISANLPAPTVAFRDSDRWLPDMRALAPSAAAGPVRIRQGGTYILTGGLGGIALTLAEALANRGAGRLVLVGRRDLDTLDTGERATATARIRAIEALGTSIIVERADIASVAEVEAVVKRTTDEHGAVHGLIHAAGVLDDALLTIKTSDAVRRVLRPKVAGTLALEQALDGVPLDFWINCSSVSAVLGLPGQIDYAAASAFLDAFAHHHTSHGRPVTSVDWQAWRDVGMLAGTTGGDGGGAPGEPLPGDGLLRRVRTGPERSLFTTTLSASSDWILDEHRLAGGEAVLPGTGFIEMAIEAVCHGSPGAAVEVQDLVLLTPFRPGQAPGALEVVVDHEDGEVVISSWTGADRLEHARCTVVVAPAAPSPVDLGTIGSRCDRPVGRPGTNLTHLRVGPRWGGALEVQLGDGEAMVQASLPDAFRREAVGLLAHPALVDLATAGSFHLVESDTVGEAFLVPISYGRIAFHHQLPPDVVCHARRRPDSGTASPDVAELDLTITDRSGRVLLDIERFTVRRMAPFAELATPRGAGRPTTLDLSQAIAPAEGAAAFLRILDNLPLARVVVGPRPFKELEAEVAAMRTSAPTHGGTGRDGRTPAVEPRDDIERQIAAVWSDLLGVTDISIDDNFFELGGHSLLAAQLGARLRRTIGARIPIGVLFERPTIAGLAEHCRQSTEPAHDEPALVAVPRDTMRRSRGALDSSR